MEEHLGLTDICLSVCELGGAEPFLVTVTSDSRVQDVKFEIYRQAGIAPYMQVLTCGDVLLQSGTDLIAEHGISEGSTLTLLAEHLKFAATLVDDNTSIGIWSVTDGDRLQTLRGHAARVREFWFPRSGCAAVTCADDAIVKVWDLATGSCTHTFRSKESLYAVQVSGDGRAVLGTTVDQGDIGLSLYDFSSGERVVSLSNAFSSPKVNDRVFQRMTDGSIRMYDTQGSCNGTLHGHVALVTNWQIIRGGTSLITTAQDGMVKVWALFTGECVLTLKGHGGSVDALKVSKDETLAITGSQDHTAKLWNLINGDCLYTFTGFHADVHLCEFSLDASLAIIADKDDHVMICKTSCGSIVHEFKGPAGLGYLEVLLDGRSLLLTSDSARNPEHNMIDVLYSTTTGECLKQFDHCVYASETGTCMYSHDLSVDSDDEESQAVQIWSGSTGELTRTLAGEGSKIAYVEYMGSGDLLMTIHRNGTATIWNTTDWERLRSLSGVGEFLADSSAIET